MIIALILLPFALAVVNPSANEYRDFEDTVFKNDEADKYKDNLYAVCGREGWPLDDFKRANKGFYIPSGDRFTAVIAYSENNELPSKDYVVELNLICSEQQRKGVGSKMLKEFERRICEDRSGRVIVNLLSTMAGLQFYEKMGFKTDYFLARYRNENTDRAFRQRPKPTYPVDYVEENEKLRNIYDRMPRGMDKLYADNWYRYKVINC